MTAAVAPALLLLIVRTEVLTLAAAEERAVKHQPALIQADQAAAASEARGVEARATLLPQVTATAGYRRGTGNRNLRVGLVPTYAATGTGGQSSQIFDYLSTNVTATQLLYDFGQSTGAWRAAREHAAAARDEVRATVGEILLNVRLAFINARIQEGILAVARENLSNRRRHLDQIQGFVGAQVRPPIDLAQARADVGNAELRLLSAENERALADADLAQAMGGTTGGAYTLAEDDVPSVADEEASQEQLLCQATRQRADLSALDRRVFADQQSLSAARGSFGPKVYLSASVTDSGPLWTPGPFDGRNLRWNYYALLSVSWPIFEGLRSQGLVNEMKAAMGQTVASRSQLLLTAGVEIERARRTIATAKEAIRVSDMTVESARERLNLAEGRYRAGAGTVLELADAQLGLVAAEVAQVQTHFALSVARARLLHALGDTKVAAQQ